MSNWLPVWDSVAGGVKALARAVVDASGLTAARTITLSDSAMKIYPADPAAARTELGLGTSATVNTGTSGATIPLLSTANAWGAAQIVANYMQVTGSSGNSVYINLNNTITGGRSWSLYSSGGGPSSVGSFGIYLDGGGAAITIDTSRNVGIGNNAPSAALDVTSTVGGFLPPRMTGTQRDAISSPATGLVLYNTTTNKLQVRTNTAWVDLH